MQFVKLETLGQVARVTISRPQALNALSTEVLDELEAVLAGLAADEAIRAVVLTGEGKAFVAGADVAQMQPFDRAQALAYARRGGEVFAAIESLPQPVIAAVNGYALGGGCELALACDMRIASERAKFGQPEVGLGITPGFGGTQRLSRCVGLGMAMQAVLTAKPIDAQEALRIGLVNAVYPPDALLEEAQRMAEAIAANAPFAVRAAKAAMRAGADRNLREDIEAEAQRFAACFETGDQKEAMEAFVQKRKARPFEGK